MGQVAYSIAEAAVTTATTEAIIKEAVHDGLLTLHRAGRSTAIILHSDLTEWAATLPAF